MGQPIITVDAVVKTFGDVRALDGLSVDVPEGIIVGLLGPNGAGKTTLIRILATLLTPDSGVARVAGFDIVREPERVRERIGLAGQYAAVDGHLTGRENIELVGRLYGLSRRAARTRAAAVVERIGLAGAADRQVRTYSGGMRRRIDVAASLVGRPRVLFLDEPTTGVDPASRREVWAMIRDLVDDGTTVVLTTQYLEEADHLADRIAVINQGRLVSEGTAAQLKDRTGGTVLELSISDHEMSAAVGALHGLNPTPPHYDRERGALVLPATGGVATLRDALRALDEARITPTDVGLHKPSLDDVFLALTRPDTGAQAAPPAAIAAGTRPDGATR
jgi:daunorubicin resistance ABC transporter ATP-binding subunit